MANKERVFLGVNIDKEIHGKLQKEAKDLTRNNVSLMVENILKDRYIKK